MGETDIADTFTFRGCREIVRTTELDHVRIATSTSMSTARRFWIASRATSRAGDSENNSIPGRTRSNHLMIVLLVAGIMSVSEPSKDNPWRGS